MNVLVAPNALKGSLTAFQAATIIARSLPKEWRAKLCPIADGGDGTLDCLVATTGGRYFDATVSGPLPGMKVNARWGTLGSERTAVIEMAEASGLRLLNASLFSATKSTTLGVGELILHALDAGFDKILVGLGGSATNDGGAGCVQALGVRLLNPRGGDLPQGGIHLKELRTIDFSHRDQRIDRCEFVCLSDVYNVLLGPTGATFTYGTQKGASVEELEQLEKSLQHFADVLSQQLSVDVTTLPGGGAAGGLGAGLSAFCRATIVSGIDYILDLIRFDEFLRDCDFVLTAEGSIDDQSLAGKGISGIVRRAKKLSKPVHAFAGRIRGDGNTLRRQMGLDSMHQIAPTSFSDEEAMGHAEELLEASVREFVKHLE